jgi:hypothetical protein
MKRLVCIATAAAASAAAVVLLGAGPEAPAAAGGPDTTPPAGACPASVSGVPTDFDTRAVPDGSHRLTVRVTDAAANTATVLDREIAVQNAPQRQGPLQTPGAADAPRPPAALAHPPPPRAGAALRAPLPV